MASTLYEIIHSLCQAKGISGGRMCSDLGLSRGMLTDLKMGRKKSINMETSVKIADYFGIGVEELMRGDSRTITPYSRLLTGRDRRDISRELDRLRAALESGDSLMFDGDPMTPEARESILAAMKLGLEAARLKNKERFGAKRPEKE